MTREMGSEKARPDLQQARASLLTSGFGTSASQGYSTPASACELPAPLRVDKARGRAGRLHKGHDGQRVFPTTTPDR